MHACQYSAGSTLRPLSPQKKRAMPSSRSAKPLSTMLRSQAVLFFHYPRFLHSRLADKHRMLTRSDENRAMAQNHLLVSTRKNIPSAFPASFRFPTGRGLRHSDAERIAYSCVPPAMIVTGINAWNLWNEHWEHWAHMPPLEERPQYPYQNIRVKNFFWGDGDKTLL